jgi:cobalt-precorrin 5A hydrolase
MGVGKAMIIAGIGCRKSVSATQVDAAIDAAFSSHRLLRCQLHAIAVPAAKADEAAVAAIAAARGVELVLVAQSVLEAADARSLTRSARSMEALNVQSASEAAALAAAGPKGRLLSPRLVIGPVTCALAAVEELR